MKSKIDELKIRKTKLTDLVNKYDADKSAIADRCSQGHVRAG